MSHEGITNPAAPPGTPNFPSNPILLVFEQFSTLNTKPPRPGIKDEEMSWCDGFMPIGPNNLRTLYGIGSALYTTPGGQTIVFFGFGNISETPYCIAILSDGSIQAINTNTGAVTQIAAAGTITNPSPLTGLSQWGSQYILIVVNQPNGYFIWDGTATYSAGTIGPDIEVTNGGSGYTSQPTFTVTTTGSGTGATFTATLDNGSISNIQVTNPGSGFQNGDLSILTITGDGSDSTASATANVSPTTGSVSGVTVTNPGSGYSSTAAVTGSGGGGTGATFYIAQASGGSILSVGVLNPGHGYTSPPTLSASGGGTGFAATATIEFGEISSVSVTDPGSGYVSNPTATVIGDGSGAVLTTQVNGSGQLSGVTVTNPGSGYTKALVQITGGNNAASANINIMPYGVSGTAIETYQGHVWIANKNVIQFSAPESVSDFGTADGGGAFTSVDSFLNVGFTQLKQSNGFLYLIADSAINYISGVSTGGNPAVTTFNNQNVDPQIGTPWPGTLQVYSRNLVFGNSIGVYVSYGGAVQKISEPLDGFYTSVPNFGGFLPSSAVATIFGIEVYMQLTPVIDQYTGQQTNKLLMWSGQRWFTSQQNTNLTYVASQKINSVLTAWGTNGSAIYPLFQEPSTDFQKVTQSKLWSKPSYLYTKVAGNLYGVLDYFQNDGEAVEFIIDNEHTGTSYDAPLVGGGTIWVNASNASVAWINASSDLVSWGAGQGLIIFGPIAVSQVGAMIGMTVTTMASDLAFLSATLLDQTRQANV